MQARCLAWSTPAGCTRYTVDVKPENCFIGESVLYSGPPPLPSFSDTDRGRGRAALADPGWEAFIQT